MPESFRQHGNRGHRLHAAARRRRRSRYLTALAGPVALTAGLSGPAAAAQPAPAPPTVRTLLQNRGTSSEIGTFLDADSTAVGNYGPVMQWIGPTADTFQQWKFIWIGYDTALGAGIYQLQNVGASEEQAQTGGSPVCLDADSQQVYNGGAVIQFDCDAWDPYQQWIVTLEEDPTTPFSGWQLQNVGASQEQARTGGSPMCVRADPSEAYASGAVMQYTCSPGDAYEQWLPDTDVP